MKFVFISLLALMVPGWSTAQDSKKEKDPDVLFEWGTKGALFTTVAGSWRSYETKEGEKYIRLSSEPVKQGRVDLGGTLRTYNVTVSAKVLGKNKGRLKPRMGVGLFGTYGFTLRIAPGREKLELVQYGEVLEEVNCKWESDRWQFIELKMIPADTYWILEGRTWFDDDERPEEPILKYRAYPSAMTHQLSGRAFLTGSPYNGYPIFYDKILVVRGE